MISQVRAPAELDRSRRVTIERDGRTIAPLNQAKGSPRLAYLCGLGDVAAASSLAARDLQVLICMPQTRPIRIQLTFTLGLSPVTSQ
jgi:metal-dependent HD superfamily phosphatase/phosphodiesterase